MKLTFGRYKDQEITDMPIGYLKALLDKDKGMQDYVRIEIEKEIKRRVNK